MLDSLETYWLRAFSEMDGGDVLQEQTGHGGKMLYEPGIADRRDSRRYTYEVVVECTLPGSGESPEGEVRIPAITQNVSRSGLALLSKSPLAVGHTVKIHFTHLENGFDRYCVCWSRRVKEGTYLSGLKRTD